MWIVKKFLSDICLWKKSRNSTVTQTSMEFLDPTLIYEGKMYMSLSFACCLLKGNMEISVVYYTLWMNLNTEISMFRYILYTKETRKFHLLLHFMWEKNMVISMFRLHVMCKRNVEISINCKFFDVFSKGKKFLCSLASCIWKEPGNFQVPSCSAVIIYSPFPFTFPQTNSLQKLTDGLICCLFPIFPQGGTHSNKLPLVCQFK